MKKRDKVKQGKFEKVATKRAEYEKARKLKVKSQKKKVEAARLAASQSKST